MSKMVTKRVAMGLIIAAVATAYANSLTGVFVLDDLAAIRDNLSFRHWTVGGLLWPEHGTGITVDGRPVLNLSLAANYQFTGNAVWSYHAVNLLIHAAAALTLWGILRRLAGETLAFATALIWAVHPLNTEAVTYVVQRAESLMGLFYLGTIYFFALGVQGRPPRSPAPATPTLAAGIPDQKPLLSVKPQRPRGDGRSEPARPAAGLARRGFLSLSVACCWCGMATKEVMVSAPLAVLLIDRWFESGSFRAALRQRNRYYASLFGSWLLLAALVASTGSRGGTSAFGFGVNAWHYWASQPAAILHYLRLAFWPHPLIFDYGTTSLPAGPLPWLFILALVAATLVAIARNHPFGILAFIFLATLAPTSLIPGNRQSLAEHRMYLALIPVIFTAVYALSRHPSAISLPGRRPSPSRPLTSPSAAAGDENDFPSARGAPSAGHERETTTFDRGTRALGRRAASSFIKGTARTDGRSGAIVVAAVAIALFGVIATRARNEMYHDDVVLYAADVAHLPENAYAQTNYGTALLLQGQYAKAIPHLEAALRLNPAIQESETNLGNCCFFLGDYARAERLYLDAIAHHPQYAEAHDNLSETYLKENRPADAEREARVTLQLNPNLPGGHLNLGTALLREGNPRAAVAELQKALSLTPNNSEARARYSEALAADQTSPPR